MEPNVTESANLWKVQPEATQWIHSRIDELVEKNGWLNRFASALLTQTGTRLFDWVDTLHVATSTGMEALGFVSTDPHGVPNRWHHPGALLPWIVVDGVDRIVIRVESVVDFLRAQSVLAFSRCEDVIREPIAITGGVGASRRSAIISRDGGVEVVVLERHGDPGPAVGNEEAPLFSQATLEHHAERLRLRPRYFEDPVSGIRRTTELVESVIADLGVDRTCDLFFQTEREYWQHRNDAANLQYRAQSLLGMGWANHDHHTYRSSRVCFAPLVRLLERLGMECRERFYAGADAGWGAQVLEQPRARIVVFADVDMTAEEVLGDFAHQGLLPSQGRGTVGLWCHLHGEAILQAGMHHLECQFAFDAARQRLAEAGAESLQPFSNFDYLRQSFTRGQMWPVENRLIEEAIEQGWINQEQAERFRQSGVTGSHLEVLERNDGYKGFNQTGISDIIARTDPRNAEME